jgi:photosystem II stability/assembly factor-like uncharacterized protein
MAGSEMKTVILASTLSLGFVLFLASCQTQDTVYGFGVHGAIAEGVHWNAIGPSAIPLDTSPPAAGKLQAFAVGFANPNIMYGGGGAGPGNSGPYAESGVFKTVDGGVSWVAVNEGLSDPMVDAIWLDQTNPEIVLVGTWFDGIFRSTDGGSSWSLRASLGSTTSILQVGQTLYAATAHGVAESVDSGATWKVTEPLAVPVRTLTASGTALYAGLDNGEVLYRPSPDSSWKKFLFEPGHTVWSVATDPTSTQTVYVVEWHNYYPDIFVSRNSGGTWAQLHPQDSSNAQFHNAAQVIAVDDSGNIYVGFDGSLYVSKDHGANWENMPGAGWDIRSMMAWPGQAGKLLVGTDQGLYTTTDGGKTWAGLNDHLKTSLLTGVAVCGSTVLTAVQDFSPIYSFDGGTTWHISTTHISSGGLPSGEDGIVQINLGDPDYCYAYTIDGLQYSTDGGHTFRVAPGIQFTFAGGHNLIGVDLTHPSNVYVAAQGGVYASTDWGVNWSNSNWSFTDPSLVVVNPKNSQTIFVGTQNHGLYVTHDGGFTWTQCGLSGAAGHPYTLDIDPVDTSIVEVGMTSVPSAGGGMLLSNDGGRTFSSYNAGLSSSTASLTSIYACTVSFNPNSNDGEAALATSNGIYLSKSPGTSWINISGDAVPKDFRDLVWADSNLYAATYGEGVVVTTPVVTSVQKEVGAAVRRQRVPDSFCSE